MIQAFADKGKKYDPETYDHVLFSFHGLPQRQLIKCNFAHNHCFKSVDCCQKIKPVNQNCYGAQSYHTATLIARELDIPQAKFTVCFQSRLGNGPWMQPYTSQVVTQLAKSGKKRLLVFCPAFVADCLETVYEVAIEYKEAFLAAGGQHLQLVESLNDSPPFIQSLKGIIEKGNTAKFDRELV